MNYNVGEPKNNKKLLSLGKEIVQDVFDRWEDTYCVYSHLEDIKDETLISIAKKVYTNQKIFLDYIRDSYNEEGFDWTDSVVESYDTISQITFDEIVKSGEYYYDKYAELFFLITPMTDVDTKEKLRNKLSGIKKLKPLMIMLDDKEGEYLLVRLSDDTKDYIVDSETVNYKSLIESIAQGRRYNISNTQEYSNLVNGILDIINVYNNHYTKWTDLETAEHFWYYIKDSYEFENIADELDKKELNKKLLDSIVQVMHKEGLFEGDMELILKKIKDELYGYHIGEIDCVENYYIELKEIVWQAINESFSEYFVSNEDYVWIKLDNREKFKATIEKRLSELENINSFNLCEVLPATIEYDILIRFIRNPVKDYIKSEFDKSIDLIKEDYFWHEAEDNLAVFYRIGNLKNITKEELESMYENTIDYKNTDTVKDFSVRYLREYLMNVLRLKNDVENKFDLIALYQIILEDIDKITPYIDRIIENGFTIEDLETKVKNIKLEDTSMKNNMSAKFKLIFNNYINKKSEVECNTTSIPNFPCEDDDLLGIIF